jgi:hypothetical protein
VNNFELKVFEEAIIEIGVFNSLEKWKIFGKIKKSV